MGLNWLSRKPPRVDPTELATEANTSLRKTQRQQAHVNALTSYLDDRTGQNGFGEDFGITLNPRRT